MKIFYTYMWLRSNGTPYYIGKGHSDRAFISQGHVTNRPKEAARILLQKWSSEQEAFEMEKYYIRLFGRKDLGTGILRNLTNGGEGPTGYIPSQETRRAIGEANKRRNWEELTPKMRAARRASQSCKDHLRDMGEKNKGRKYSPEHCQSISASLTGRERSPSHCENMRRAQEGRPWSEARRKAQDLRSTRSA